MTCAIVPPTALKGDNSALVLCTGGGKTLCYQMVAALSPPGSLTVVVSPLISLMEDQLRRLPPQLPGACLASNLSMQDMARCACHGKQCHAIHLQMYT